MKEGRGDKLQRRSRRRIPKGFLMKDRNERVSRASEDPPKFRNLASTRGFFHADDNGRARMRHRRSLSANYLFYARQYWICPYYWNTPSVIRFNARAACNRRIRLISSESANRTQSETAHLQKMAWRIPLAICKCAHPSVDVQNSLVFNRNCNIILQKLEYNDAKILNK